MASQIAASIGHYGMHGYSATFDVQEAVEKARAATATTTTDPADDEDSAAAEPLKVLLVGPGDLRHVLTTVARRRRHHKRPGKALRPLHFYVLESPVEILARELLLLEALLDFEVPIRQRATVFLEVYGNCKVQDRTARYVEQLGHQLRALIVDGRGRLEDLVDLSHLRYRERDALEDAFRNYACQVPFDVDTLRDHRIRGLYAERYDARKSLADWDYYQNIKNKASIVHIKQYKEWTQSGVAFEFGDQTYTEPNRTMMSYAEGVMKKGKEKGMKKEVRGFWADVVASPYFTFGVDCEKPNKAAEGLFEIQNKNTGTEQHRHHAVEVALYNLISILWEVETGGRYVMTKEHDVYSGLGVEASLAPLAGAAVEEEKKDVLDTIVEEQATDEEAAAAADGKGESEVKGEHPADADADAPPPPAPPAPSADVTPTPPPAPTPTPAPAPTPEEAAKAAEQDLAKLLLRAETIAESLHGVEIIPLAGPPSAVLDKPKLQGTFDAAFVSARFAQCIEQPYFTAVLRPHQAVLAVETAKFLVPLAPKVQVEFNKKESEYASTNGWKAVATPLVPRRRRDERDPEDDVAFFTNF